MTTSARNHHHIPQCYLRWFTRDRSDESKLLVLDFKRHKSYETAPRNIASRRDFNRVEIEGVEPNAVEIEYGQFEGKLATALRSFNEGRTFDGEARSYILNLIALLSVRSPQQRENWRQFRERIADRIMDIATSDKQMWESQVRQMKSAGTPVSDTVTYERAREFYLRGAYTFELDREDQIRKEMKGMDVVLRSLSDRTWITLVTDDATGHFVTSDHPAVLTWKNPERIPLMYRHSPGHGRRGTELLFPVSKYVALSGSYYGSEGCYRASREMVALCNTTVLDHVYEQLYAADATFPLLTPDDRLGDGRYLLERLSD